MYVHPRRCHDKVLFTAFEIEIPLRIELAQITGVKPTIPQRRGRELIALPVPARNVLATNKNLSIPRKLCFPARQNSSNGPAANVKWIIHSYERSGFCKSVSLHNCE